MLSKAREFRRGWPVLLASAMGAGTGVAALAAYSFGALVDPLTRAFGWSRAEVTAAPLFTAIGFLVVAPYVGALADRFGARTVAIAGQVLLVPSFAALSLLTPRLWMLYAAYFLVSVAASGTLPMVWSRAVTGWFVNARGVALGVSLMANGLIGGALPSYVGWLVGRWGWQGAFIGLAALPLALSIPLTLWLFREPPASVLAVVAAPAADVLPDSQSYTFGEAIRTLCFWQMAMAFILASVGVSGVLIHALSLLGDRGVSPSTAAIVAGLFGPAVTVGRLISGSLLDVFRGPKAAVMLFILPAAACGLLTVSGTNLGLACLCIGLIGLSAGAESDVAGYLTAKYFGRGHYGAVYGLMYALYSLGGGIGPLVVGAVYDVTRAYTSALYGGMAVFLATALLLATLRGPLRRSVGILEAPT